MILDSSQPEIWLRNFPGASWAVSGTSHSSCRAYPNMRIRYQSFWNIHANQMVFAWLAGSSPNASNDFFLQFDKFWKPPEESWAIWAVDPWLRLKLVHGSVLQDQVMGEGGWIKGPQKFQEKMRSSTSNSFRDCRNVWATRAIGTLCFLVYTFQGLKNKVQLVTRIRFQQIIHPTDSTPKSSKLLMRLAWRASIPNLRASWFTKLPNVFLGSMGTMPTSRMIFRMTSLRRGFVNTLPFMEGVQENTFRRDLFFRLPRGKIWPVRWISSTSSRLINLPTMTFANRPLLFFWSAAFPSPHGFRVCLTAGNWTTGKSSSNSWIRIALTTDLTMVKAPNSYIQGPVYALNIWTKINDMHC